MSGRGAEPRSIDFDAFEAAGLCECGQPIETARSSRATGRGWRVAERVPRHPEPLDAFEEALAFAVRRALERDREMAARRRTMRLVERPERRGGTAA